MSPFLGTVKSTNVLSAIGTPILQSTAQGGHIVATVHARDMQASFVQKRMSRRHIDALFARTVRQITLHGHRNAQFEGESRREQERHIDFV